MSTTTKTQEVQLSLG